MHEKPEGDSPPNLPLTAQLRSLPRNVKVVTATSFFTDISREMIFSLLPLYLANVIGVSTGVIGLVEGFSEATSSLLKLYSGWLSDRIGKRKPLAVLGYGFSAVSKPLLSMANSWFAILGVRFADRVGKGIRTSPRDALIADSVPERSRGLAFGLHRAGDTAGAALGIALAIVVIWFLQGKQIGLTRETFQAIAILSALPALLAVLILAIGARELPGNQTGSRVQRRMKFGKLGKGYRNFLIAVLVFTLGNSADAFIILRAQERDLSVLGIIVMLLTFNITYAVIATPVGLVSDRIGRR